MIGGVFMYKIGFIDDDTTLINDYIKRLKRKDIDLVFVKDCITKNDVLKWILENEIKCMLVDYKLTSMYNFNGTELVAFLNSEFPDLPCIILTNYCNQGISENLVIKNLFIEKENLDADFSSQEFEEMITCFKQAVNVFDNRLKLSVIEYEILKKKKAKGTISQEEEELFISIVKILRAYNEVDDMPIELLTTNATKKMSDILKSLDKLLNQIKFEFGG